jgi:hypothetical protein
MVTCGNGMDKSFSRTALAMVLTWKGGSAPKVVMLLELTKTEPKKS